MESFTSSLQEDDVLESLNTAQRHAVTSKADTVAILAGPGSGKTHTLTSRVVWLVNHVKLRPADVIVATFTVKAAREMRERIGKALGREREKSIVLGTFHSIARRYLATYGSHIGLDPRFGIADDGDSRALIQRICKRLQVAIEPPAARSWISKKKAKGTEEPAAAAAAATAKTAAKASRQQTDQQREYASVYEEYQAQLGRSNLLDYDDLLVRCVDLLKQYPACVANVQAVLIDEYQDTNGIQYELMKLFAQARRRITIVGDPDQSIYGWRSAEVRNLYRLLREFPRTHEVSLEENYRSSQSILGAALSVIQQDKKRYQKALKPVHDRGCRPVLRKLKSGAIEGEWIVSEIQRIGRMTGGLAKNEDVVILLRSAALSRHVESALGKAGIAYRMIGGFKFYERAEVKILLDYLRVIYQPDNNDALARILNVPRRGVGETTIRNLLEEAEQAELSLWALLVRHCRGERTAKTSIKKLVEQRLSGDLIKVITASRKKLEQADGGLVDVIQDVLVQARLRKYVAENWPEDHEQRWANVQEFLSLAGDFVGDPARAEEEFLPEIEGAPQTRTADALGRFLANVSLASEAQTKDKDGAAVVTISTIHAAKGLEWPVVFVPAVYNGSIPHSRAEDTDEERRLLYVAMTRAKALLYLSWPMFTSQAGGGGGSGGPKLSELSSFLPPDVTSWFAKKGPLFERPVVEEVARVLARSAPSQDAIFGGMAPMAYQDDDLFPVDPEESPNERQRTWTSEESERRRGGGSISDPEHQGPQPQKRRRMLYSDEFRSKDVEILGRNQYVTTMDQAATFTMASLPGFTTAGAHRAALQAASVAKSAAKLTAGDKAGRRPANQKTLVEFTKVGGGKGGDDGGASGKADTGRGAAHYPAAQTNPATRTRSLLAETSKASPAPHDGGVEDENLPQLVRHRPLGRGDLLARPRRLTTTTTTDDEMPRRPYPYFSSSPGRPDGKGDDGLGEHGPPSSPTEQTRPMACLHATTVTMPAGLRARFTRTEGLRMGGVLAPVARLQKPFRPLTISRQIG